MKNKERSPKEEVTKTKEPIKSVVETTKTKEETPPLNHLSTIHANNPKDANNEPAHLPTHLGGIELGSE